MVSWVAATPVRCVACTTCREWHAALPAGRVRPQMYMCNLQEVRHRIVPLHVLLVPSPLLHSLCLAALCPWPDSCTHGLGECAGGRHPCLAPSDLQYTHSSHTPCTWRHYRSLFARPLLSVICGACILAPTAAPPHTHLCGSKAYSCILPGDLSHLPQPDADLAAWCVSATATPPRTAKGGQIWRGARLPCSSHTSEFQFKFQLHIEHQQHVCADGCPIDLQSGLYPGRFDCLRSGTVSSSCFQKHVPSIQRAF